LGILPGLTRIFWGPIPKLGLIFIPGIGVGTSWKGILLVKPFFNFFTFGGKNPIYLVLFPKIPSLFLLGKSMGDSLDWINFPNFQFSKGLG